jgi:hypothetical protein
MKKALIWAPAYYNKSAGIVACHMLCEELRKRGIDAYIQSIVGSWLPSPYDAPKSPVEERSIAEREYAHIYPECLYNAPTCIKTMPVRNSHVYWWMLSPRIPIKDNDIPKKYWDYPYGTNNEEDLLGCDVYSVNFSPSPTPISRKGIAVYEGKGHIDYKVLEEIRQKYAPGEEVYPITKTGSTTYELTDLVNLFRRVRFTVLFDCMTAATINSLLCSTPVYYTEKNSILYSTTNSRLVLPGMFEDLEELPKATKEAETAYDVWQTKRKQFDKELDRFANIILC